MTLRVVIPASGAAQLTISYLAGVGTGWPQTDMLRAGQVLDVLPGSPLESAIGAGNLTALTGALLANAINGSGNAASTGNA